MNTRGTAHLRSTRPRARRDPALSQEKPATAGQKHKSAIPLEEQHVTQVQQHTMEEDHAAEQQDDLESMIAHMRAEALRRGKDWLRAKMEDKNKDPAERIEDTTAPPGPSEKTPERATLPPQKPSRRQRSEGKQASKPTKRARVVIQTAEDEAAATPADNRPSTPAEGEHISAIIKECFKSLAPLLLRGDGRSHP
ncbi:hypothetical protein NDU88_007272 [Pleurodeles waltl]|uniref:Uncharacterized protein n=1 Tax=Pleurodeles waltl TaxID=8319 RepID=A0AAV7QP89_PLEWA|nr:hypothetical protein NDU88_007272 [Pleurodeles waltl]